MGAFLVLAALLVLAAVAVAAWPLLRQSRRSALALVLVIPAVVGGLYWYKGRPEAVAVGPPEPAQQVQQAEAELVQRLAREPDNFEAWVLLGRMRMGLQAFDKAAEAFAQAQDLMPDEPNVMVEYAEAQMRASRDRRFPPAAVALLDKALAGNPRNQRALFFIGMHLMQNADFAGAAQAWERLLPLVDARTAAALLPQVNDARSQAGLPPMAMPSTPSLTVRIDVAPALKGQLPAGSVLYVFARRADGDGPPVAARRIESARLPMEIELTDADSVMPVQKLSLQPRVQVGARLSRSGSATPASGDMESDTVAIDLKPAARVELILSDIRP